MKELPNLSMICTLRCNLSCELCMLQWMMRAHPGYDLPMDDLHHFIRRCEELKVRFRWAWFTGGEPTIWPHIVEGITALNDSPSFVNLRINTNGTHVEVLEPVVHMLSNVRMSVYHTNKHLAEQLYPVRNQYKLGFWSEPHRKVPDEPVQPSLPAPCICPVPSYFNGRLYHCPGGYSVAAKLGLPLDDERFSVSVDEDFYAWYKDHEKTRLQEGICEYCISNGVVYKHQESTQEEPVNLDDITLSRGRSSV